MTTVAYISRGKLFLKTPGQPAKEHQSPFALDAIRRATETHEKRAWKHSSREEGFVGGNMLWGGSKFDPSRVYVAIQAVSIGAAPDELLYVVEGEGFGGLFTFDLEAKHERRIMHRNQFVARDLARHAATGTVAYALRGENGTSRIVVADADLVRGQEVTEGDSIDEAPSWAPGVGRRLVYQSAGVARNGAGYAVGVGPAGIYELDLDGASARTVLEDPKLDLLQPRYAPDGTLWFIRRPYKARQGYSPLALLKDIVLFPFRLARTAFHFLNFMSLVFSRKPLSSANGQVARGGDEKFMILRGRVIDAEKALQRTATKDDAPAVVPRSWELVARTPSGEERVAATGVVAFDIAPDGTVAYSNGTGIFLLRDGGDAERIEHGRAIESLSVIAA